MDPLHYPSKKANQRLDQILSRRFQIGNKYEEKVKEILNTVKKMGDKALVEYTRRFDCPSFVEKQITTSVKEIEDARKAVNDEFMKILRQAISNITEFHSNQREKSWFQTHDNGTILGQVVRPVDSAGLYIPGGKGGETPLVSSVLMNTIPAMIAGVTDIAMVSPPRTDGTLNPYLLVAATEVGVTRIHKLGSAWAIAALAFGTESVSPVDVIVGPGNVYVMLAKKLVSGIVGIDMLAGPSEILVIADETGKPREIAADLLSQAEHDPMASSIMITTDRDIAKSVSDEIDMQLASLPRSEIAQKSWENYGAIFIVENLKEAIKLANVLAPEHLELIVKDPFECLGKIRHAGAIFLGAHSPEAVGDYFAGPNHVLPTSGTARFSSALGVNNFLKRTSVVSYSKEALKRDAPSIMALAQLEGLEAHANSIKVRITR